MSISPEVQSTVLLDFEVKNKVGGRQLDIMLGQNKHIFKR